MLFGAVSPYAYTFMAVAVLAGSLFLLKALVQKEAKTGRYVLRLPRPAFAPLFFLLLAFLFFQILPLPETLITALSPEARAVGEKAFLASSASFSEAPKETWYAPSAYAHPVRMSIVRWTVYGLLAAGLCQVLNSRRRINIAVSTLLSLGCFEVLYGLHACAGPHHILWYRVPVSTGLITGTYVNHNHFAGLLEMLLMLAAAYIAALADTRQNKGRPVGWEMNWRARLSRFVQSREVRIGRRTLAFLAGAAIGIGLLFSASRGGILSGGAGLMAMGLLFLLKKGHRGKGLVAILLFAVTVGYAVTLETESPLERFNTMESAMEQRERFALKAVDLWTDYRAVGVGVGNFAHVYPRYQSPLDGAWFIDFAHNDWAQFLAEAGLTGMLLMVAGISYLLYRMVGLWLKRQDPFAVCIGTAPIGAMTAIGVHSWVDFNLHVPANFLMLAAVTAIGCSALNLEWRHGRDKALLRYAVLPLRGKGAVALALILTLIAIPGLWAIRHFIAEAHCATLHHVSLNRDPSPPVEKIMKAIEWDGWNAAYRYKMARELMRIRHAEYAMLDRKDRVESEQSIIRVLEEAVRLNPFVSGYHMELGWAYVHMWILEPEAYRRWLGASDVAMERAAYFAGNTNAYQHFLIGNYWVMRSKTVSSVGPLWSAALAKAGWHYKKNLYLESGGVRERMLKEIRKNIWVHYPDEAMVQRLLD